MKNGVCAQQECIEGMEVEFHSLLILLLGESVRSAAHLAALSAAEEPPGTSWLVWTLDRRKNLFPMAGIEARFLGYSIAIVPTKLYGRLITVDLMLVETD
jgi:hypothetical protein